jgi:hypothetical protein
LTIYKTARGKGSSIKGYRGKAEWVRGQTSTIDLAWTIADPLNIQQLYNSFSVDIQMYQAYTFLRKESSYQIFKGLYFLHQKSGSNQMTGG